MENERPLLLIFTFFLLKPIAGTDCFPASCGPQEPQVRFPFRILDRQQPKCGFPGFDLSCDQQNKTVIQLPSTLPYIVKSISYLSQVMYIDPEFCRPNRIFGVNVTDTSFVFNNLWMRSYTFFNCSQDYSSIYPNLAFPCLSSGNYSVLAMLTDSFDPGYRPANCTVMKTIMVPVEPEGDIRETLQLLWLTPYCKSCEREGETCKLVGDDGRTICVNSSLRKGISKNVKYGLSIGIGVPALICVVGLVYYASSKVQAHSDSHNQGISLSSTAIIPQPISRRGLDGPTIESYPKTKFGDSYILPNDDNTCPICLCHYKCKESLRKIPECNHYFHAECIDEWLKLNGTCPVCRNTPKSLASVTPCSSQNLRLL